MPTTDKSIHIDIPVKLSELKIAFSIAALAFEGDLPASIFHLQLITRDVADWAANNAIIAVFHTNAGHVTLNDKAYNAERMVATGNPYKELVAGLIERGVQIELCGATATVHHWGMQTCFPESKSIPTPWRECRSSRKKVSSKSRNGTEVEPAPSKLLNV